MLISDNERKKPSEKDLRETRERPAVDGPGIRTFMWYVEEDRTRSDTGMISLFGLPSDTGHDVAALECRIHPDDRARYADAISRATDPAGGGTLEEEIRVLHPDGRQRWLAITGQVMFDGARRRAVRMAGTAVDITGQRETQRQSEARYRTLFESIDEGFCIIEVLFDDSGHPCDYRFLEVNPAFERHTGLVGALGKRMRELAPRHEEHWFETYGNVALTGEAARFERPADELGRYFDVYAFRVGEPEMRQVAVLFNDITERKRVEDASRRAAAADAFRVTFTDAVRPLTDPIEIKATACRVLGEALAANRVAYFEMAGDEYVIERDYVDGVQSIAGRHRVGTFDPKALAPLQAGHTVSVADVKSDAGHSRTERAAYAAVEIRSYIAVPLLKGRVFVSGLTVHSTKVRAWTPDEIALVEETAERTWAAVQRARAEAALHEADRRKDEFLATLAHELRNPLAPLRTGLELMHLAADDPRVVEESRTMMERQVNQLVHLVDDLLDVSRITLGKIQLRPERVDLAAVVRDAVEMVHALIEKAGHELTVELPQEPLLLEADPGRLAQVLSNLLNNAAKYTQRGGQISLSVERSDREAIVSVRDNGVGIAPDQLAGIFDLFIQYDHSLAQSHGGLGIGLTLVKQLVELHGGTVGVKSAGAGCGAEFTIRLPLAQVGRATPAPVGSVRPAEPVRRRLLVVDDNRDAVRSLALMLEAEGNEVRTACDGLQALEAAAEFHPEAVLLDLRMPGLDGFATARRMRAEPWGQDMMLIALTGWGQEKDRRRTREAGFDHHLVKPVDMTALRRLLGHSDPAR